MNQALGHGYLRSDFRVYSDASRTASHWLVRHVYGRELLRAKLRESGIHVYRDDGGDSEVVLDRMVDELGLRDWTKPATLRAHSVALIRIVSAIIPIYWRSTDRILRKQPEH